MEHLNSGDALKSFFTEEFKTTNYGDGWLCPDVSSFELFGDPSQYFEGKMIDNPGTAAEDLQGARGIVHLQA